MAKNVKNTTFPGLLDLIAPHSCRGCGRLGTALCDCCKNYIKQCKNHNITNKITQKSKFPPIYTIGTREDLLANLIHDYKYYSIRAIGTKLAELMYDNLPSDLPQNTVIVPLPTSTKHIRERGFDHTLFIAKKLAHLAHFKVQPLLLRNQNTVQVGSDKKTRLAQAKNAYAVNPKISIDPTTTYLLLDDVWTTGASMKSAVKKLRSAGAKKLSVALLAVSTLEQD